MNELNPYGKFLDGRPVHEILAATPATLAGLVESIGPAKSTAPSAPGKWSPAEIISHLADCEVVFAFRLRQTLAEDGPTIQPFDQEKWAAQYGGISATQALNVFTAVPLFAGTAVALPALAWWFARKLRQHTMHDEANA